ncbi:hypothetical protein EJB00_03440 [Wolbachia endosymbiont of Drosophila mauritiana]|nr:hypothetical protein EJA99_03450 [Wolbachia endosymbiont of Drosophila mauritiana]QCB63703.1 hypothetical protein EJB00_03440 [Wolbachia endosymbiont of Drosophila mauritiana]TGB06502.1 hypothetical protein E5C28_03600 [Wolbachia endosymbiont of Drosophila mauritiana]
MEYLVKEGAILDAKDYRKNTPLHLAAKNNHLDVVKYLIKEGANCDIKFDYGWTLLHLFARKGNLDGVKLLMENEDFSSYFITRINAHDKNQGTALDMAAQLGHLEIVKLLKEKHASVLGNASFTPLHLAAEGGYLDVVEYLVKEGAILDVKDYRKNTPLHLAAKNNHLDVVKYLVEKGAKVDIKNNRNLTPRDLAKEKFNQNPQIYQEIIGILKSKPINRQQENDNMYQIGEVSAEKCLPSTSGYSGRKRREVGGKECLFTWEDVDEFNVEKDENRDLGKIKIDSEKFVNYIKDLPEGKRSQLIQLADEVRVTGNSQGLVNKLTSNQKVMNHLNRAGRISGMTMHGMMAKNVLADFLNGNYQGVAVNIGFIAGGQGFAKVAEAASIKGLELASKGKFLLSRSLKAASPFLARGTSAFIAYDLVNQVKAFKNGTEGALVGVVGDSIYLSVDAAEIGIEVAESFAILEGSVKCYWTNWVRNRRCSICWH